MKREEKYLHHKIRVKIQIIQRGMMAYTCDSSFLGDRGWGIASSGPADGGKKERKKKREKKMSYTI